MANRNFIVGDTATFNVYNPDEDIVETVITQVGPVTFTAKITTSKYDPISEEVVNNEYPLTLGVVKAIDVDSSMAVKLVCVPIGAATFTSAVNGFNAVVPVQATQISYQLSTSDITGDDIYSKKGRQFAVKTAVSSPDKITVGDAIEYDPVTGFDKVVQVGAPAYSALMRVTVYDPVAETYTNYDTELPLGVPTIVDFKKQTAQSQTLICEAFPGKQFSGASNGLIEIAYDKYAITYKLTDPELPPNPDSSRQYLVQVIDDVPGPTPEPTVTNNYRLTRSELKEFQKLIFASQVPEDVRKPAWEFVSNVFIVPFVVPAGEIDSRENIKARDLTFNIADRLKGNTIKLDMGIIQIPGRYGNSLDYYGSDVSLYMPFKTGEITLDPFQVIGGSIRLEYEVNPTDGNTTLNIYNDSEELIQTSTFRMGSEYPFYSYYEIQDKFYSPENVVNALRHAYAIVKIPNYTGIKTPKVTVSGNLEGVTGRVDFSEVSIDNIPYADEYDELISKLKNGVVIK